MPYLRMRLIFFFTQFIGHEYHFTCVAHFYEVPIERSLLLRATLHDLFFYQKNNTIINNLSNICIFKTQTDLQSPSFNLKLSRNALEHALFWLVTACVFFSVWRISMRSDGVWKYVHIYHWLWLMVNNSMMIKN